MLDIKETEVSINELINKITHSPFNHMIWIGQNFSIKDLIVELTAIKEGLH